MKNKLIGLIAITTILAFAIVSCASMSIESVDWESLKGPAKVRQYLNVSTSEVTVYATYKDGNRKEVSFFSPSYDVNSTGTQTVTVTVIGYKEKGTFQTEVMPLQSIRIEKAPSKTSYTVGEKAELDGIKVMGTWKDMPDAEIPSYQITVSSFNSSTAGSNRPVTVAFKGKTATFPVTVNAAPVAAPAPAAVASTPAPSTTQPSQPAQQSSSSAFNPAPNQPSPVGIWKSNSTWEVYTFNSNGTGRRVTTYLDGTVIEVVFTSWSTSGNMLTFTYQLYGSSTEKYIYSISGNTLTLQDQNGRIQHGEIKTYAKQ